MSDARMYRCERNHAWTVVSSDGELPLNLPCPFCEGSPALSLFALGVEREMVRAREQNGAISSLHAGYAIILEELDEFWDEVKKKPGQRREQDLMQELIQVASMARRVAEDLGLEVHWRPE